MSGVSANVFVGYLGAIILLMLTPGPDMMFVLANATRYGARAGVVAAFGVAAGEAVHIAAVVAGLAGVIAASPTLYAVLRWAGAAYLVFLGVRALRGRPGDPPKRDGAPGWRQAFGRGLLTNLLNPKMILFSVAFLPQFVDPSAGDVTGQLLVLGAAFVAVQLVVDVALGAGAGRLAGRFTGGRWAARLDRLCAVAFIGLGLRLAVD